MSNDDILSYILVDMRMWRRTRGASWWTSAPSSTSPSPQSPGSSSQNTRQLSGETPGHLNYFYHNFALNAAGRGTRIRDLKKGRPKTGKRGIEKTKDRKERKRKDQRQRRIWAEEPKDRDASVRQGRQKTGKDSNSSDQRRVGRVESGETKDS